MVRWYFSIAYMNQVTHHTPTWCVVVTGAHRQRPSKYCNPPTTAAASLNPERINAHGRNKHSESSTRADSQNALFIFLLLRWSTTGPTTSNTRGLSTSKSVVCQALIVEQRVSVSVRDSATYYVKMT